VIARRVIHYDKYFGIISVTDEVFNYPEDEQAIEAEEFYRIVRGEENNQVVNYSIREAGEFTTVAELTWTATWLGTDLESQLTCPGDWT